MTEETRKQISLLLTSTFPPKAAEELRRKLAVYLDVGKPGYLVRKAADPTVGEQFIQLIGSAAQWIAIAGAAGFIGNLGKLTAEDVYAAIKKAWKQPETTPLVKVSEALAVAMEQAGPDANLIVGLDIPDRNWGTALYLTDRNPENIALGLARFTSMSAELSSRMEAAVEAGRPPLGRAIVTIEDDGTFVVRWRSQKDFAECELRIPWPAQG